MSDLKAPTKGIHAGRQNLASGLYGPTVIHSRSDIANGVGAPRAMSDLKAPTYKNRQRRWFSVA